MEDGRDVKGPIYKHYASVGVQDLGRDGLGGRGRQGHLPHQD